MTTFYLLPWVHNQLGDFSNCDCLADKLVFTLLDRKGDVLEFQFLHLFGLFVIIAFGN